MEENAYRQSVSSQKVAMEASQDSRDALALARTISIVIMCVILMGIIPIFGNMLRRRYRIVEFLQYLGDEQVKAMSNKCLSYQKRLRKLKEGAPVGALTMEASAPVNVDETEKHPEAVLKGLSSKMKHVKA
jgi:hypothetical protein